MTVQIVVTGLAHLVAVNRDNPSPNHVPPEAIDDPARTSGRRHSNIDPAITIKIGFTVSVVETPQFLEVL